MEYLDLPQAVAQRYQELHGEARRIEAELGIPPASTKADLIKNLRRFLEELLVLKESSDPEHVRQAEERRARFDRMGVVILEISNLVRGEIRASRSKPARAESSECGLRAVRWPWLRWDPPSGTQEAESVESDLAHATPLELDRRFRAAIAFLQCVDFEIGRILRQILERGLYRELGFESFEDYVVERLDLSPRTARRLVRLVRAPETVATAFREGRITLLAAEAILRGAPLDETVTLRKLQEQLRPEIDFWAPPDVARLFLAMVARVGLERLLDHAIGTWIAMAQPGHEVFERDRWCYGTGVQRAEEPPPASHRLPLSPGTRRAVEPNDALRLASSARRARERTEDPGPSSRRSRLRARGGALPLGRSDRWGRPRT